MSKASSPRLFSGLKISTPLTASAIARRNPFFVLAGFAAGTGSKGIRQALSPTYFCGSGTCCCQARIPTISGWSGMPLLSTKK